MKRTAWDLLDGETSLCDDAPGLSNLLSQSQQMSLFVQQGRVETEGSMVGSVIVMYEKALATA